MKHKYPGFEHVTFNEAEEFARRLWARFWKGHQMPMGSQAFWISDEAQLRHYVAEVFHEIVREKAEDMP